MADKQKAVRTAAGADPVTTGGSVGQVHRSARARHDHLGRPRPQRRGRPHAPADAREHRRHRTGTPCPRPSTGSVRDLVADDDGFLLLADNDVPAAGNQRPAHRRRRCCVRPTRSTGRRSPRRPVSTCRRSPATACIGVDAVGHGADVDRRRHDVERHEPSRPNCPAGSPARVGVGNRRRTRSASRWSRRPTRTRTTALPGKDYLLFSTDGISWRTTDLATRGCTGQRGPDAGDGRRRPRRRRLRSDLCDRRPDSDDDAAGDAQALTTRAFPIASRR